MKDLVDSHCHLDFSLFEADRMAVISRAKEANVSWLVNPSVDVQSSKNILKSNSENTYVYPAIGIHPNTENINIDAVKEISELINEKVVAIGEIGLDYYREINSRHNQRELFINQLYLASQVKLPVIIHCRQAFDDLMALLIDWTKSNHAIINKTNGSLGVIHSFSGSVDQSLKAIELNFFIGISGPVTYKNSNLLCEVVKNIPLDSILVETDAPFLTPHPLRGKRNEPAFLPHIAQKIAELKQVTIDLVAATTSNNARKIFNRREND